MCMWGLFWGVLGGLITFTRLRFCCAIQGGKATLQVSFQGGGATLQLSFQGGNAVLRALQVYRQACAKGTVQTNGANCYDPKKLPWLQC